MKKPDSFLKLIKHYLFCRKSLMLKNIAKIFGFMSAKFVEQICTRRLTIK